MLILFSCAKRKHFFHTEIVCPGKAPILIRYTNPEEVLASIDKANAKKKAEHTSEDYTVIYASGDRSVKVPNVSPEAIKSCKIYAVPVQRPDKAITKFVN